MKKAMIVTSVLATVLLSVGIVMKYMHAPGTSFIIITGILIAGFLFMPLLFAVRVKEKKTTAGKLLLAISTVAWMSAIIGVLFRIEYWPGTTILFYATPFILLFVYLPVYFFSGMGQADTRTNTIAYSTLIVISCGLFFTLTVTPATEKLQSAKNVSAYLRSEQILKNEKALSSTDAANNREAGKQLLAACEEIKAYIVERETGYTELTDANGSSAQLNDKAPVRDEYFAGSAAVGGKLAGLKGMVAQYNATNSARPVPYIPELMDMNANNSTRYKASSALNDLVQVQLIVLQGRRM